MTRPSLVVKTKLVAPRLKVNVLKRTRLLKILKKNLDKKLILICGDAGYGKTTLLAQLCAEIRDRSVYYSVSPADSDVTTFFRHIVAAIRQTHKYFGEMTESILEQTQNHEIIVGTFINEFFALINDDLYIVVDDLHNVQDNPVIMRGFEYLLQHQPQNMHLVVASRIVPPFDLSFYLTKQELCHVDTGALRFDTDEIRSLLGNVHHLSLADDEIERVVKHSQGWITAVQLILQKITMSGERHAKMILNGYVASGEELFDYFAREVFEHQPARVQDFMLHTSFLRVLTPRMCNHILRISTSASILKRLEREHAFISPAAPGVYAYHPLFRAFINDRARKRFSRTRIRTLHAAIGKYYIGQNDLESAIDIFLQGGLFKNACTIMKRISESYIESGRFNRLFQWFSMLPADIAEKDTTLQNLKASILWHTMRIEESLAIFKRIIRKAKRDGDSKNLFAAQYGAARIYTNQGKFAAVKRKLTYCLTIPGIPRKELVNIYNLLGICHVYLNEFVKAETMFEKAASIQKKHGGIERNASLMNNLAIVAFTKGELERAVTMFRKLVRSHTNRLAEAHIHANIALALVDLGRLHEARGSLAAAFTLSRQFMNVRAFHQFLLSLGFYYLERCEYGKAAQYFNQVLKASQDTQERLSEQKARHGLLKTYYLARNTEAATVLLSEIMQKDSIIPSIRNHDVFLLKGLVELQSGDEEAAEHTLVDALAIVEGTEFKYSLTKNLYFCASLYLKRGIEKVTEYLGRALSMAKKNHYDYFLMRQVRYSADLVEYAMTHRIESAYAERILSDVIGTSTITLGLFDTFDIAIHGYQFDRDAWQTRKAQVMFAYLMLNRHHPIAKERLISIFAAQDKPVQADQDIRTTISRIQKALPWKTLITYQRGFYRINSRARVVIDAEKFGVSADTILNCAGRLDESMLSRAEQARDFYQGDFLVGYYDQWSDEMRNYYKGKYARLLDRLAEHYCADKQYERALRMYRAMLDADPLNEEGHVGVLRTLRCLDRHNEAASHYQTFRQLVRSETGVDLPTGIDEYLSSFKTHEI